MWSMHVPFHSGGGDIKRGNSVLAAKLAEESTLSWDSWTFAVGFGHKHSIRVLPTERRCKDIPWRLPLLSKELKTKSFQAFQCMQKYKTGKNKQVKPIHMMWCEVWLAGCTYKKRFRLQVSSLAWLQPSMPPQPATVCTWNLNPQRLSVSEKKKNKRQSLEKVSVFFFKYEWSETF